MQENIINNGIILGSSSAMGHHGTQQLHYGFGKPKLENSNNRDTVWGNIVSYLFPSFRPKNLAINNLHEKHLKKMLTAKMTWAVLGCFGISAYAYTCVCLLFAHFGISKYLGDIDLGKIENPAKSFIILFGLIFMAVSIMQKYEKYRKDKIENDKEEHRLKMDKANDHHTHSNRRHL
jgi:hypothetical protein